MSRGFRRPRRRRPLYPLERSTRPSITASAAAGSSRSTARAATSRRCRRRRDPDATPIRLTDRFFDPGLRGFDIRGIGPRVVRIPYNADGTLQRTRHQQGRHRRDRRPGLLHGPARARVPDVSSGLKSLGLRPSAFVDVGSLWNVKQPQLLDIVNICSPLDTIDRTQLHEPAADCSVDSTASRTPDAIRVRPGFKEVFLGNSPRPRLSIGIGVNWISPFGPLRIDLAKAIAQAEGRRHQTLHLQRRNSILMKKLLISASLAASALAARRCSRPGHSRRRRRRRRPREGHQRVHRLQDRDRGASRQVTALAEPRAGARAPLQTEGKSIQAAVDALNGKEPDAALKARVQAFQTKQQQARAGSCSASSSRSSATRQYIQQADRTTSSARSISRSCSAAAPIVMVEIGATLASGASARRHQRRAHGAQHCAADGRDDALRQPRDQARRRAAKRR